MERILFGSTELEFIELDHRLPGTLNCVLRAVGRSVALLYDTGPELPEATARAVSGCDIGIVEAAYPDSMQAMMK